MNEDLNNLIKASKETRGAVLEVVCNLEWAIDMYIANYFTGKNDDKFDDFISLIITPNISFRSKTETFRIIVNKIHPEFLRKNPSFPKDFTNVVETRNILAHYPLYTKESAINTFNNEQQLQYLKLKPYKAKDTKEILLLAMEPFKDSDVNALINMVNYYIDELLSLIEAFEKGATSP